MNCNNKRTTAYTEIYVKYGFPEGQPALGYSALPGLDSVGHSLFFLWAISEVRTEIPINQSNFIAASRALRQSAGKDHLERLAQTFRWIRARSLTA